MLQGLHLNALVKAFLNKIEDALHINDLVKQVENLFDPQKIGSSNTALSNHATSASKVYEVCKFKQVSCTRRNFANHLMAKANKT